MVAAVILGWNPREWSRWDYHAAVEQVAVSGRFLHRWNLGPSWRILPETEVWLLLQGSNDAGCGLIGHGVVMSAPVETLGLEDSGTRDGYVSIAFDALLPFGEQVRPDILSAAVPGVPWGDAAVGPVAVPPPAEPDLRRLWREQGPAPAGPAELVPGTCPPDAVARIEANRYERDADARRICLAFHGTSCAACGFSFEVSYGNAAVNAIEVHHLVPPAMLQGRYGLDPVADLVPLCPNCHAVAHLGVVSPRTVSELRNIIAAAGRMTGEVVTERALDAQDDARRILEGPRSIKDPG
jgi:5-methylcytosine-specific restriction protein A